MSGALDRLLLGARGEPPTLLPMPQPHQIAGAPLTEGSGEVPGSASAREAQPWLPQNPRPGSISARDAQSSLPRGARPGAAPAHQAPSAPPHDARSNSVSAREAQSSLPQDPGPDLRRDVPSTDDAFAEPVREMRGTPLERRSESAAAAMKREIPPEPSDRGFPAEERGAKHQGPAQRAFTMQPALRAAERAAAIRDIPPADAVSSVPPGEGRLEDERFVERHRLPEHASATRPPTAEPERAAALRSSLQASRLSQELGAARESVAAAVPAPPDRIASTGTPELRGGSRPNAPPRSAAQGDRAVRQGPQTQSAAAVQVTIGRVEVKAAPAAQPVRPRAAAPQLPKLSLADYLKRRGSRSP